MLYLVHSLAEDILRSSSSYFNSSSSALTGLWLPPPDDMVKLNVDASVMLSLGRGGVGGIIRNNSSEWITGFSASVDSCNVLHTEILAILRGLDFAWGHGFRNIVCETDSLEAYFEVTASSTSPRHSSFHLIKEIQILLTRNWIVRFSHVLRSGNTCADFLARHGAMAAMEFVQWDSPNDALQLLLLRDSH